MAKKYFCAYHSYLDWMENLTDAERGRLFTACLEYSKTGVDPDVRGNETVLFPAMKRQIDEDNKAYQKKCDTNRTNGSLGGIAKATERYRSLPNARRTGSERPPMKRENNKTPSVSKQSQSTRPFIPPTLEDVEKYCKERNNGVDAKRFYDYYADADWTDQNGKKVRNWKQKIIAVWERTAERSENDAPVERDYTAAPDGMRLLL